MVVEASLPGLIRTLFIIGGVFLLLRFIGQFMIAKRNMEEEREINEKRRKFESQKRQANEDSGKTRIISKKSKSSQSSIEDVDFEEID